MIAVTPSSTRHPYGSLVRTCRSCDRTFDPSSRHLDCPSCRSKDACACGASKQRKSSTCSRCRPNEMRHNGNWKGGRSRHKAGYVMIRCPDQPRARTSGYVSEHILVMEDLLGRHLHPEENVHHVNGIRWDNRPVNLELWIRPQPTGIRVDDAIAWARTILERYEREGSGAPPTTLSRDDERSWRWRESNPRP